MQKPLRLPKGRKGYCITVMDYIIQGRSPAEVFHFFEEICAIPHPSFHEERIADYLEAFAAERHLECYRDELNNILIKKPATPGLEGREPLLLQGHTDMVCEKNGDVEHDFMRDPLQLFLEGDLLGARGTTLGGDDGIAVAMMLAALDGALPHHPDLECLFTVAEEVGLNGAHGFDVSKLRARRMINLDSEDLGVVTAGCAGGLRSELMLYDAPMPFAGTALTVTVKGLAGGHSGVDINRGRANANKWMGRLLSAPGMSGKWNLVTLSGGSKDNAIPRECRAVVAVEEPQNAMAALQEVAAALLAEWDVIEPNASILIEPAREEYTQMLSGEASARVATLLFGVENGVKEMNQSVPGLVEWSRNLGVIDHVGERLRFVFSTRSAIESRLDASIQELDAWARLLGCTTNHHSRYPGWSYAPVSPLREAYLRAFRTVTGKEARIDVIHAGLECGILYSKCPELDIISIGPDMRNIHSPDERLDLSSVELFWRTLVACIEAL